MNMPISKQIFKVVDNKFSNIYKSICFIVILFVTLYLLYVNILFFSKAYQEPGFINNIKGEVSSIYDLLCGVAIVIFFYGAILFTIFRKHRVVLGTAKRIAQNSRKYLLKEMGVPLNHFWSKQQYCGLVTSVCMGFFIGIIFIIISFNPENLSETTQTFNIRIDMLFDHK